MKTYRVSNTFETVGIPAAETYRTPEQAEAAAEKMREGIAIMVADWETPDRYSSHADGWANEIEAWEKAEEIAGVEYDEDGDRTANSPTRYGIEVGRYIAKLCVGIEEREEDE